MNKRLGTSIAPTRNGSNKGNKGFTGTSCKKPVPEGTGFLSKIGKN